MAFVVVKGEKGPSGVVSCKSHKAGARARLTLLHRDVCSADYMRHFAAIEGFELRTLRDG